ncbi:MAG: protease complex subunit PrcB family protein [Verrucomicrobiae bacterium]|nr:protease complex subunit PrcB family protein [Verrucomicrobiae bacterium]
MITRKTTAYLRSVLTALGAMGVSLVGSATANAQFLPFWLGQGVVLEASDIYDDGVAAQSLQVTYYDGINPESLGDDEIWVVSPDGFNALAKFEGYEEIPGGDVLADPELLDRLGLFGPEGDPLLPWLFDSAISAKYSLPAPDGNAWNPDDNGSYSVLVAPESVALKTGGFVGHQLLGTFGVRIGEPLPVQVDDWNVDVLDSNGVCNANVRLKFASATDVEWGEVMRDGERLFVRIEATTGDAGARAASHSYALGDLPPGQYLFEVRVNDRLLDATPFVKRDTPLIVPARTDVAVLQGPAQPLTGNVTVQFTKAGWAVADAGEIQRSGNRFFVNATAARSADGVEGDAWTMDYPIPEPEPGIYTFTFCLNGQVCDSTRFAVAGPDGAIRVQSLDVVFTGAIACPDGIPGGALVGEGECLYDHVAGVTVALSPQVAVVDWGTPERLNGRTIVIDITTAEVPGGIPEPDPTEGWPLGTSHRYDLGLLEAGEWSLLITSAGQRLAKETFNSPASSGLNAELRTAPLDPERPEHQFNVIYSGFSPVDVSTLGDDDIQVTNPILYVMDLVGPAPDCLTQFAKLVDYAVATDGGPTMATYSIRCTDENWAKWGSAGGFAEGLDVFLAEGGVSTVSGVKVEGRQLGVIPFKSDAFHLTVHADARPVHEPGTTAKIYVSYDSRSPIDVASLGDGDIVAFEAEIIAADGTVTPLAEPLYAALSEYKASDDHQNIEAVYNLAPANGWTAKWNGHYILTLPQGELTNESGQPNKRSAVGTLMVDIEPDLVIGDARIAIRQDGDKVLADVKTDLRSHMISAWGNPVLRGNIFYLDASADPSTTGSTQEHTYQLLPQVEANPDEPVEFEPIPGDAILPAILSQPFDIVIRTADEWEAFIKEHRDDASNAETPAPPVDFGSRMIVGIALGRQPSGFDVQISGVVISGGGQLVVRYDEIIPGVQPPEDAFSNPIALVSIPQIDVPVSFEQNIIALPGPAPDENGLIAPADPFPLPFPEPPINEGRTYAVVFRVNGQVLARTSFSQPSTGGILAKASIDIESDASGVVANVNVAFPGYPYHHMVDWGNVRREGNAFYLPAKAERIDFIVDPGVVEQSHRYRLLGDSGGGGKAIPFEPLELENWLALEARNLVIQTPEEWADAWSSLVPFDSLPPAPPVDLETHTLLAVLQGPQPNGCYAVNIEEVTRDANGSVTVHYKSTVPGPDAACPEVITHPQSFVVIEKIAEPVTFTEQLTDPALVAEGGGFRIIPSVQYPVYFLINDVVYARSQFSWRPGIPKPRQTFDVAIDARGGENAATVRVEISTPDGVIGNVEWGEPAVNGHSVNADVALDVTPWSELPEEVDIEEQTPVEHTYELVNLPAGFHTFRLTVNGVQHTHAFFLVRGDGIEPVPFDNWLAGLIGDVHDAVHQGLAEAFGDLDGDGVRDIEEFYFGTHPLKRDQPEIRPEWIGGKDGKSHLAICFQRNKTAEGVTGLVEASENLHQWVDSPDLFEQISVTDLGNGLEEVIICLKQAAGESPFQFLRLRMQQETGSPQ